MAIGSDVFFEEDLRAGVFEGLRDEHPLYRRGRNFIATSIEHHVEASSVRYKVVAGDKTEIFNNLEDAVLFYNANRKRYGSSE